MAKIPYAEAAIADLRKIADYCLNPEHPRGRHKARVFREALGIEREDAEWLRDALLEGLRRLGEGHLIGADIYGERWRVDIPLARHDKHSVVRTIWLVPSGSRDVRLVTCWVL